MDTYERLEARNQIRYMQDAKRTLRERRQKLQERVAAAKGRQEITQKRSDVLGSSFAPEVTKSGVPSGAPSIRRGESAMTSRGYSFARAAALVAKVIEPEDCKVEMEVGRVMTKAMQNCPGYRPVVAERRIVCPLDPGYMLGHDDAQGVIDQTTAKSLSQCMYAGTSGFDPQEATWVSQKYGVTDSTKGWTPDTQKVGGNTQSWLQQNIGGALIPYPEMGPVVPLLRNKNALMTAGAQVVPLPPQGRLAFPRQTAPTTTYHVGEGVKITQSAINTDQFVLSAKKIGALIVTNNELIRYGGPVVEQMFRNDMTISLGLQLDFDLLQAEGSDNVSAGLIAYPGVTTFTPTVTGANGNTLSPQDIYTFIGQIRANNGTFEGWIIRPELLFAMVGKRASVLSTGDGLGLFLFDILRDFDGAGKAIYKLGGYTVTDTANAPANRVKGAGNSLTALYGGMWSDYRIGLYGTIEIATADQGDNLFPQDQTMVRAILSADGGPWHPGVFGVADQLLLSSVGS